MYPSLYPFHVNYKPVAWLAWSVGLFVNSWKYELRSMYTRDLRAHPFLHLIPQLSCLHSLVSWKMDEVIHSMIWVAQTTKAVLVIFIILTGTLCHRHSHVDSEIEPLVDNTGTKWSVARVLFFRSTTPQRGSRTREKEREERERERKREVATVTGPFFNALPMINCLCL